ncbi:MAG: hypothetical protein H0X23_08135 [Rubrobacter sp.]|jgi:hypothetical protein|nr:hypothetical protein [Rubrobacter sp.]
MLARLRSRLRPSQRPEASQDLNDRAAAALDAHERVHAALFERSARLAGKARRLDEAGTPSESAQNRADRAAEEVEAELAALRVTFVDDFGEGAARAFDSLVRSRYPAFDLWSADR